MAISVNLVPASNYLHLPPEHYGYKDNNEMFAYLVHSYVLYSQRHIRTGTYQAYQRTVHYSRKGFGGIH